MSALWGLVLAGGKSERMGRDKGRLSYHGAPHREWLADVLAQACERVFISVSRPEESESGTGRAYLVDEAAYAGNGPIGALLSANAAHPHHAWLVVSCDLPFFGPAALAALTSRRDASRPATAFLNPTNAQPEPLVTIYEAAFMDALPGWFGAGERSMRRIMARIDTHLIREFDPRWLTSADTPEGYAEALRVMRGQSGARTT